MSSLNKVQIIGKLGKDPDIRTTQNGNRVASFSVATSETWKDKNTGEKKEKTEWIPIVIFNEHLVGVAESYLRKGSTVYIEGKFTTRKWTDSNGTEKYTTEVVLQNYAGELKMLGKPPEGGARGAPAPATRQDDILDDDIPF